LLRGLSSSSRSYYNSNHPNWQGLFPTSTTATLPKFKQNYRGRAILGQPSPFANSPADRWGLAKALRPSHSLAGDLRATGPIPRHLLPGGQLDPGGPNHRADSPESAPPRQCGACAGEGYLSLPLKCRCPKPPLPIRVSKSCGDGINPTHAGWSITPSTFRRRCASCGTRPRKTAAIARAPLPRTGRNLPNPKACAKSPLAKRGVNRAIPVARSNPATGPSISRFTRVWSVRVARTSPGNPP
jgi:hypothetical protein